MHPLDWEKGPEHLLCHSLQILQLKKFCHRLQQRLSSNDELWEAALSSHPQFQRVEGLFQIEGRPTRAFVNSEGCGVLGYWDRPCSGLPIHPQQVFEARPEDYHDLLTLNRLHKISNWVDQLVVR